LKSSSTYPLATPLLPPTLHTMPYQCMPGQCVAGAIVINNRKIGIHKPRLEVRTGYAFDAFGAETYGALGERAKHFIRGLAPWPRRPAPTTNLYIFGVPQSTQNPLGSSSASPCRVALPPSSCASLPSHDAIPRSPPPPP
jgi:hypothetical protein